MRMHFAKCFLSAVAGAALLAGCATMDDVMRAQEAADAARMQADQALAAAQAAAQRADQASSAAQQAQQAAQSAQQNAEQAGNEARAANERAQEAAKPLPPPRRLARGERG